MQKFAAFVVKSKWIMIALFAVVTVVCGIMVFHNKILYDLSAYAPKGSHTEDAVKVLKQEFDDKGSAYVMVRGVGIDEAVAIGEEVSNIDGVAVAVFDASKDYKNNSALYSVVLDNYDATPEANAAIAKIISYLDGKESYLTGQSAMSYYTRLETLENILKVAIVIVCAILGMLLFTSKTYFELVIMILVFGVSVVLNMGTNFIFNGISYVSNLVSLVLQLALSIDYSVILLHRFLEEYEIAQDASTAAKKALQKGIPEILSSSFTTIAGLSALILMTLPIGVEMGLSLAKSIAAALLCVLFLMPALLVIFSKTLQKTKHKRFVPDITKPARAILKVRKIIVPLFLVLVVLAGTGQFFNRYSFNINGAARIVNSNEEIAKDYGMLNSLVVIVPKGDYQKEKELTQFILSKDEVNGANGLAAIEVIEGKVLTDQVNMEEMMALGESFGLTKTYAILLFNMYIIQNDPDTEVPTEEYRIALIDLLEYAYELALEAEMDDNLQDFEMLLAARKNFEGTGYSRIIFNVNSAVESDESLALIDELYTEIGQFYDEFYLAGESVACYDMANAFPVDNMKVNLCTVFFVMFILLLTFRNFLFPLVIMLAIQGGIWINFAIPLISGNPVSFIGYLLISAIQMGATIDYGIVLTSRFRSTKKWITNKADALAEAENAVFPTIITSGTILTVTGFALGLLASGVVAQMGMLLGVGALSSMMIVLFVLPSMLLMLDKVSELTSFDAIVRKMKEKSKKHSAKQ